MTPSGVCQRVVGTIGFGGGREAVPPDPDLRTAMAHVVRLAGWGGETNPRDRVKSGALRSKPWSMVRAPGIGSGE